MSEKILRALMQLFAIIARVEEEELKEQDNVAVATRQAQDGRKIVEMFLRQELSTSSVKTYMHIFEEYLDTYQGRSKKSGKRKSTASNSVKVLRICTAINEELAQRQKIIVLFRILEFINANAVITPQELEFAETVADTFNVSREEFDQIRKFVELSASETNDAQGWLFVNSNTSGDFQHARHIYSEGLRGEIRFLHVKSVNSFFFKYFGKDELLLNGQVVKPERHRIFTQGSSLRSSRITPIYYSDVISSFLSREDEARVVFEAKDVVYRFRSGKVGLYDFNFNETSGSLIGIMGGSGAGKSTLLNVLNGNYKPSQGSVTINGVDIHSGNALSDGLIGYVSQDDLLIEELTVFQNLYYNAKLCFGNLPKQEIVERVDNMLIALGLNETRELRVGSPLDKTISGGQRKRLNIALELIREPNVLFVDEPTSGLSSRDSENIMDLLKELALKGKLVFVVIHQPSSDIFKMFDRLLILDQGGYPIYNGNPVDAVTYFKRQINHVKSDESECTSCGNVNPELIFNIIESKVVDEYGSLTMNRKVSPLEWNQIYREECPVPEVEPSNDTPKNIFKIPNKIKQFGVFFTRDVLSKLTNRQYMVINLLEAPALAAILAFFVKYFRESDGSEYMLRTNENLPQFLFISVVVSLFLGLTVSAEEIIKDQKILKREKFLHLSKGSYLYSKILVMFFMSAVQSLLFVVVGNLILDIQGMWLPYWLVLFSTSCFANVLGLNISATFNSAKVIYILIPILIIPQLLFSGVIVKFDRLNPLFKSEKSVPLIGNVMASRWAYEALAVTQFKDNEYEKNFFYAQKDRHTLAWKKDYWLPEVQKKLSQVTKEEPNEEEQATMDDAWTLLANEIAKEEAYLSNLDCKGCLEAIKAHKLDEGSEALASLKGFLETARKHYIRETDEATRRVDSMSIAVMDQMGKEEFFAMMDAHRNEALEDFVTNKTGNRMVVHDNEIVRKANPVYHDPVDKGFFGAHFYAPSKYLMGEKFDTLTANLMVIWGMSLMLIITLYFDFFRRTLAGLESLSSRFKKS